MHKKPFLPLLLLLAALLSASCSDTETDDAAATKGTYVIDVLYSPTGLGDAGYNDLSLNGITKACNDLGIELDVHQPVTMQKGWDIYKQWLSEEQAEGEHRLFIFAENGYADSLKVHAPAEKEGRTVILFETEDDIPGVSTFLVDPYGASFMLGRLASLWGPSPSAATLAANPEDMMVDRFVQGFKEGYLWGDSAHVFDQYYIAEKQGEGYNLPDRAYEMCDSICATHEFIFPIAGGSNMGILRYVRSNYEYPVYVGGVDVDLSPYSTNVAASVVKHIDKLLGHLITEWHAGKALPHTRRYGLDTGYPDLVISRIYEEFFTPYTDGLKELATERETEYAAHH